MNDEGSLAHIGALTSEIAHEIVQNCIGFIWQNSIPMWGVAFAAGGVSILQALVGQLVTGAVSFGSGMLTGAVSFGSGMVTTTTKMASAFKILQAVHEIIPKETTIPHAPHNATISEQAKMEKAKEKFVVDAYQAAFALAWMISCKLEEIWPNTFYWTLPIINFILMMVVMYYSNYFIYTRTREQGTKNIDPPPNKNKPRPPPKKDKPTGARSKSPGRNTKKKSK